MLLTNLVDATTDSLANAQPLNVGRFGASSTRNLTGNIDMVRITPRALTPAEFLGHWTQFDADEDLIPDTFERASYGSLEVLGADDTDGDGVADAVEFALGTDALADTSKPQLSVSSGATSVVVVTRQRALPGWLDLQLECSSNLTTWLPCAGSPALTALGDGTFQRSQSMLYPSGAPPVLFFRLQLNRGP